jgi:hypothetical protein
MKKKLILGVACALLLTVVATCGCTSTTSNGANSVTLSAMQKPANYTLQSYYGSDVVVLSVGFTNNNAGTFKFSTDNFYLTDSTGSVHSPVSPVATDVSNSGISIGVPYLCFTGLSGAPATLRYYDGNIDVSCNVSGT